LLNNGIQRSVSSSSRLSFLKQRALWSFFSLFIAWAYYFGDILFSIFFSEQPALILWSTRAIAFITILLIYIRRKVLANTFFTSSQLGLLGLFLLSAGFILGGVYSIHYVEQSSVMLMLPAIVMTTFGPAVVRTLLFPLLYLMLVIPLQDSALQHRSIIIWSALILFLGYLGFLRVVKFFKKPNEAPVEGATPLWRFQNSRWLIPTLIAFSTLMVSPWLGGNIRSFYPPKHTEIILRAPLGTDGWQGPQAAKSDLWAPVYSNASAKLAALYFTNSVGSPESIFLYTAYYDSNRSFEEMLDPKNTMYNRSVWKKIAAQTTKVILNDDESTVVLEVALQAGAITRLVWYWYYIAGVSTIDLSTADFLDKVRVVSKHAQGSGCIALSTSFAASPVEARERLEKFLKVMYGSLDVLKRPEITYTTLTQGGK